jgi:hypothetical protein
MLIKNQKYNFIIQFFYFLCPKIPPIFGFGTTVFAKIAIFAPSEAHFLAISSPIPLEPPVITIILFFKLQNFSKLYVLFLHTVTQGKDWSLNYSGPFCNCC